MERLLDQHAEQILQEYRDNLPEFEKQAHEIYQTLQKTFEKIGLIVAGLEYRVKKEDSLAGKLELKGAKYKSLADITDIVGVRVITYYSEDVDKVASAVDRLFEIDWDNSVDKRKLLEIDTFGYMSLHYICSKKGFPFRFEVQMRTILQHAWANMNHDTGYKSGVEIPKHYMRSMNRLAGMLELIDEEFSHIRVELADYRRRVQALVASGNLNDAPLDGETYRSYLNLYPFQRLNKTIAAINQAEIQEVSLMPYLEVFKNLGFATLGDIDRFIKDNSEAAFQLASFQISLTDLDIISSSLGPQNLCIVHILKTGGGTAGLRKLFDTLNGPNESNEMMADYIMDQARELPFMNEKKK
jgi:ppGpp synthetase/RelA/SpoT-type nucleotidyltranferase